MKKLHLLQKIIKEIILPLTGVLFFTGIILSVIAPVQAQGGPTSSPSSVIEEIGGQTKLPGYQSNTHSQASYEPGAANITSAIYYTIDFLKYILGSIAIVTIIISGIRLITASRQVEEVANKQKEHLKYAVIGLLVVILADPFIKNVFFGEQGEIFESQAQLTEAAKQGSEYVRSIYTTFEYFAGALAILMIVIAGFRLVTARGDEGVEEKSKKTITYAVIGLILLGVAELVVKDIIFPQQGSTLPDIEKAKQLIVKLTNFITGFISTLAFVIYIYAGYLYVTDAGKEENTTKAKKAIFGTTIGLLIALAAFAIVHTTVKLEPQTAIQQEVELPADGLSN
jgi:cytochrome c biogenesis protein CcdA